MGSVRRFKAHPQSAPGDFYVVNGECISCGAPHAVAPDLIGWSSAEISHCVWRKQPETARELEQAFAAFDVCCVGCYRYAGSDPQIMSRIGAEYCDQAARKSRTPSGRTKFSMDNHPTNISFTLTASKAVALPRGLQRCLEAVASLFKQRNR